MLDLLWLLVGSIADLFRSRIALEAEILVLRRQIIVLRRGNPGQKWRNSLQISVIAGNSVAETGAIVTVSSAKFTSRDYSDMSALKITAGPFTFDARLETEAAPKTCAAFLKHMPFKSQVVHVRWSGEAVWIPLGDLDFGVGYENHTSYPAPGQIILYPGGISETEILLAYGGVRFASKMGQLAGNHFITITSNLENVAPLGKMALWKGAQDIVFERA
jgi:hypothetical protein